MNKLQPTETFFERLSGEIAVVTRISETSHFGETNYYGKYCTGPKANAVDGDGNELEFYFGASNVAMTYPRLDGDVHTNIGFAFAEAIHGNHVAHATTRKGDRTVAIRPYAGKFNIDLSAHNLDIRTERQGLTEKQARHLVELFLHGYPVDIDYGMAEEWINQGIRDIEILTETMTPTRVRIEYEMPNTGTHQAWRKYARVDDLLFMEIRQ